MLRKCLFQDCWQKDSAYQEWVLKDKLDKHYTRCVSCKIQLIFCVPYCCDGPYKIYWSLRVLIRPLFGSVPCPWESCFSMFSEILLPLQSAMTVTLPATPGGQAEHNPFPGRHICIKGFEDTVSQHIILGWHGANFFFFYICLSGM